MKASAIVVEDQIVSWDYIKSVLEPLVDIKKFCKTSLEAELAFREFKPNLVWLDCYLGEISELSTGLKNSGIILAEWIKAHETNTKIILFTASLESSLVLRAKKLKIDAVFLGAKFEANKDQCRKIIQRVLDGEKDIIISSLKRKKTKYENIGKMTLLEFSVVSSMILGKSTAQIAEDLLSTRKQINNVLYRVKEKYQLSDDLSRNEILEYLKEIMLNEYDQRGEIPELYSILKLNEEVLKPIISKISNSENKRIKLKDLLYNTY